MKQLFIKKEGNPVLLLFFAGWGSDENLFGSPVPEGCDYLLCFDYKNMDFDYSLLDGYQEIRVLAWSMGVWVACQTLTGKDYPYGMRLAVNGTPYPIHDTKGIPEAIFRGTLENFSEPVLVRCRRRICGSATQVKLFLAHHPYRTLDDLHQELADEWTMVKARPAWKWDWDKAIVGTSDKIFPPQNQREAWQGVPVEEKDVEHYDEELFRQLLSGESSLWTRP